MNEVFCSPLAWELLSTWAISFWVYSTSALICRFALTTTAAAWLYTCADTAEDFRWDSRSTTRWS